MLLRKIIIGGAIFAMLGAVSFYAAPVKKMSTVRAGQLEAEYRKATQARKNQIIQELTAAGFGHIVQRIINRDEPSKQQVDQKSALPAKKMSTVRAGQLEAEYRKATQPRKDQIIQELTAAGFDHIAQRIIKRDEPSKQQVRQKPTQVAVVQPIIPPAPETQVEQSEQERAAQQRIEQERLQQEKNLLEQRKKNLLQYKQQLEQLEREIEYVVISAKMVSEVDALSNKIDALQVRQKELYADEHDIKKLRENLAQKKQLFLKKQEQERNEIEAKVKKAVANAQKAESLDQINQALSELNGEKLRAVFGKLESDDQKMYQDQLSKEIELLEKKKQKLLQQQTEKEKAEQEIKAQEEAAKKKAERDAALKAEQEKKGQEELELENKRASLRQDAQKVIKMVEKAHTINLVLDAMDYVLYNLDTLEGTKILQEKEKEELEQHLKNSLDILIEKVNKRIATNTNAIKNAKTESQMRPLLDAIQMMKKKLTELTGEENKFGQLLKKLQEQENDLLEKVALLKKEQDLLQQQTEQQKAEQERKAKEKAAREAALKAEQEKIKQKEQEELLKKQKEEKAREEALRVEQEKKKNIEKVRKDISKEVESIEQKSINDPSLPAINDLLNELESTNKKISESEQKLSITIDQREKEKLASIKQKLQNRLKELEEQEQILKDFVKTKGELLEKMDKVTNLQESQHLQQGIENLITEISKSKLTKQLKLQAESGLKEKLPGLKLKIDALQKEKEAQEKKEAATKKAEQEAKQKEERLVDNVTKVINGIKSDIAKIKTKDDISNLLKAIDRKQKQVRYNDNIGEDNKRKLLQQLDELLEKLEEQNKKFKDFVKRRDELFKKIDNLKDFDESKNLQQEIIKLKDEIVASNLIEQLKIEAQEGFHDNLTILTNKIDSLKGQEGDGFKKFVVNPFS